MNPFAALESDDEDESFTKVQSNKKTDTKKPTQASQKPSAAPVVGAGASTADKRSTSTAGGRGGGGRGDNRNKGRGAGRGGKETGDRTKTGKREFDRRSGTGRGTEVTKGGAGKGGWGTNEEEITAQRRELDEEGEANGDKTTAAPVEKTVEVEEEPVEPEAPTFTMEEFLAKRDAARQGSSVFTAVEVRKVTDDFSGLTARDGANQDSFIKLSADKNKGGADKSQRSAGMTKVTNLGFHSAPKADFREDRGEDRGGKGSGRGGKGSGGRGGDRDRGGKGSVGGGGRGGGSDRRSAPRAGGKVDISDQSAFPSL